MPEKSQVIPPENCNENLDKPREADGRTNAVATLGLESIPSPQQRKQMIEHILRDIPDLELATLARIREEITKHPKIFSKFGTNPNRFLKNNFVIIMRIRRRLILAKKLGLKK